MKTAHPAGAGPSLAPVLAIILVSYLMTILDVSIVITALPKIRQELHFTASELAWVHSAYTLAFGGLLLLGARAGDILGRRRLFVTGLAIFTTASLVIDLTQSAAWLLGARAIQGIGAAVLAPSTLALLSTNFPEGPERTRAVAYYGATAGIGTSVGLVLGGLLTDWLSWRIGFFINLPVGIALMLAARRYLRETERHAGRFDLAGALSSTLGMTSLVYAIVRAAEAGWSDTVTMTAFAAGTVLLVFFVINEWRAPQPILPLRLLASYERSGAYAARCLFYGGMLGFWFFTTQFLQGVYGFSPIAAGAAFLPMTLVSFFLALAVPRLTQRFGNANLLAGGLAISVIGLAWLSRVAVDTPYLSGIALPMVLIGVGQGMSLSPLTVAGIAGVAAEDAGAASGLVNVTGQIGGSLGLSALSVIFAAAGSGTLDAKDLLAHRIASVFAASTAMLVVALVLVLALIVRPGKSEQTGMALSQRSS